MDDAPLRGADAVDDDLEVGFNAAFEHRWHTAEMAGRVFMALFVIAGLAGLLGQGPFSHRTLRAADSTISVDYEPVARLGTGTQVTLHLSASARPDLASDTPVRVSLDTSIVEPMGLQGVNPQPARTTAGHGSIDYLFDVTAGEPDALVRLQFKPTAVGPVHLWARQNGGETLAWTQMVLP